MEDKRRIAIVGKVTITCGDEVIVYKMPNAIVRQGLRHFASGWCLAQMGTNAWDYGERQGYWGRHVALNILFGKSALVTTCIMDDLTTKINSSPTSGMQNSVGVGGNGNYYFTKYQCSWASGILNGFLAVGDKLSEIGLYYGTFTNLSPGWTYNAAHGWTMSLAAMISRIGLGTNAFIPNINAPVAVEWEIGVEFV